MNELCRQTYIFLALKAALSDLRLQSQRQQIESLFLNTIKNKIAHLLDESDPKEPKNNRQSTFNLEALQILERQHPVGSEDSPLIKYSSVLYQLEMPTNIQKKLKISQRTLALLQSYSEQQFPRKKQQPETTAEPGQGTQQKSHKALKLKVFELMQTQKAEASKRKKQEEKRKRQEAKQAQLQSKREQIVKKRKFY